MLKLLYEQSGFPVFQNRMYNSVQEAKDCPKGDICLVEDSSTGLVYNAAFQPNLMNYDGNYQNEQGLSDSFRHHLEEVAAIVMKYLGRHHLVEVGCGKGFFVELLLERDCDIIGFDVTYEGSNPRLRKQYFERGVIDHAEGLVLRHVLEHIQNPYTFLQFISDANGGSGRIYIEVPCFDWICNHKAWFDVFYEHVNYFRLADFHRMFGEVIECGHLFGGQYIFVVAELSSLRAPFYDSNDPVSFPTDFSCDSGSALLTEDGNIVVWGGASKGVIFSLLRAKAGYPIDYVIDINPAKQGKYLPATGLEVRSPEDVLQQLSPSATIFVMNSNYLDEIKYMSKEKYKYLAIDHV